MFVQHFYLEHALSLPQEEHAEYWISLKWSSTVSHKPPTSQPFTPQLSVLRRFLVHCVQTDLYAAGCEETSLTHQQTIFKHGPRGLMYAESKAPWELQWNGHNLYNGKEKNNDMYVRLKLKNTGSQVLNHRGWSPSTINSVILLFLLVFSLSLANILEFPNSSFTKNV